MAYGVDVHVTKTHNIHGEETYYQGTGLLFLFFILTVAGRSSTMSELLMPHERPVTLLH